MKALSVIRNIVGERVLVQRNSNATLVTSTQVDISKSESRISSRKSHATTEKPRLAHADLKPPTGASRTTNTTREGRTASTPSCPPSQHQQQPVHNKKEKPVAGEIANRLGGSTRANRLLEEQLKTAKPQSAIPSTPGYHIPYFGSYFNYKKPFGKYNAYSFTDSIADNYKKYGRIYRDRILGVESVNVLDLDAVRSIYHYEGKVPIVLPIMKTIKYHRDLRQLSPGLGNSNGDYWYRLRKGAQGALMEPKSAYNYLQGQNVIADEFVNLALPTIMHPTSGKIDDIENEIARFTLESMTNLAFDKRIGSFTSKNKKNDLTQKFIDYNDTFFRDSLKLQFALPMDSIRSLSPTWTRAIKSYDFLYDQGQILVDEALFNLQNIAEERQLKDGEFVFIRKLMQQKNFSYKDLSIVALSLLVDSLKTSGSSLSSQLYMLACNPEKQQLLYEEIRRVCPDASKPITKDQIEDMVYLKAVLKETLRLMPNAIDITRILQKDLVICGYRIKKGTIVNLYHPLLLRDPAYVKDPLLFKPERWLPGSGSDINPCLHLPFGFGFRSCPGRRVAEMDMSLLIIKMLQQYKLSSPGSVSPDSEYVFLKLYKSLPMFIHKRN